MMAPSALWEPSSPSCSMRRSGRRRYSVSTFIGGSVRTIHESRWYDSEVAELLLAYVSCSSNFSDFSLRICFVAASTWGTWSVSLVQAHQCLCFKPYDASSFIIRYLLSWCLNSAHRIQASWPPKGIVYYISIALVATLSGINDHFWEYW